VFGRPIDRGPEPLDVRWRSIHRSPPPLSERATQSEIFETGIKAIDVLVPLERGGKAGLFGGAGVGKTVLQLQTLAFVVIVFGNRATTYNNRVRLRLWSSRPSIWLIVSSVIDIVIAAGFAIDGIAMKSIPARAVLVTLAAAALFAVLWDFAKVPVFRRLNIS
jgi:hypothetical protein